MDIPSETILSRLVPAVALGNAVAIVFGGLLERLGKAVPFLTGNGQLVRTDDEDLKPKTAKPKDTGIDCYARGMIIATAFYALGCLIAAGVKLMGLNIHSYAWMIIAVAAAKCLDLIPEKYEESASVWYTFVSKNWTAALMLGSLTAASMPVMQASAADDFVWDEEATVKTISSAGVVTSSLRWQEASEADTTSADINGKVYLFNISLCYLCN